MPTPLVSIILPTHNGRKDWLSLAIESVLQQSFEDFELIIIDDASTTTISETIRTYCAKDSRIVFVQNKENLKLTKTLNKGISLAQGKYIARIDDDDIRSDPEKLANQVLFMENNPEYVLCGCSIQVINEHDELGGKVIALSSDAAIRCNFLENNPFFHSSVCIRKSALDQVGYYDSAYDFAEDYELWARLGKVGLFYNFADIFIHYRIAMHSVSRQKEWKQKKVSYQIYRRYRKDYPLAWIPLVRKFLIYLVPRNLLLSLLPLSFLLWIRSKLSA